jgi:hypothetical protein
MRAPSLCATLKCLSADELEFARALLELLLELHAKCYGGRPETVRELTVMSDPPEALQLPNGNPHTLVMAAAFLDALQRLMQRADRGFAVRTTAQLTLREFHHPLLRDLRDLARRYFGSLLGWRGASTYPAGRNPSSC